MNLQDAFNDYLLHIAHEKGMSRTSQTTRKRPAMPIFPSASGVGGASSCARSDRIARAQQILAVAEGANLQ